MTPIIVRIPLRTISAANACEHWRRRAARVRNERTAVALFRGQMPRRWREQQPWLTVSLTRIAPRMLDGDNWQAAAKGIRDQIAVELGLKSDNDPAVTWVYSQVRGGVREYAVEVMFS